MTSNENNSSLDSLGKHCSLNECNRLDYLPVRCEYCSMFFCKEHSSVTAHICTTYQLKSEQVQVASDVTKPTIFYKCSFSECNMEKELVEIICDYCKLNFCMKHRIQTDHKCPVKQELDDKIELEAKTKEEIKQQQKKEFKFEMKQNVSEKNSALSAKLTLMKLRQTAKGPSGLPEDAKYYCFVQYDNRLVDKATNDGSNKKPFYFNVKWPVGKCIEFLIDKLNLIKQNLPKLKLHSNEILIDNSLNLDQYIKATSLAQGATFDLKLV